MPSKEHLRERFQHSYAHARTAGGSIFPMMRVLWDLLDHYGRPEVRGGADEDLDQRCVDPDDGWSALWGWAARELSQDGVEFLREKLGDELEAGLNADDGNRLTIAMGWVIGIYSRFHGI